MIPSVCISGSNQVEVTVGVLTIYYSYTTPVAFCVDGELVVSENVWSRSTGKHIGKIPGAKDVPNSKHEVFKILLSEACAGRCRD